MAEQLRHLLDVAADERVWVDREAPAADEAESEGMIKTILKECHE